MRRSPDSYSYPIWTSQWFESAKAFEAFAVYRDLGPQRSIRAAAEELGKAASLLERWSTENEWVERAAAYDKYLDDQQTLATSRVRLRSDAVRAQIEEELGAAVLRRLRGEEGTDPLDASELGWDDIARFLRLTAPPSPRRRR